MKRIILILILTLSFQPWTKADDIRDFQIEGISIGDSLLKYYNLDQINNFFRNNYNNEKFYKLEIADQSLLNKLKKYDSLSFHFKKNDNKYIVQNLGGIIFYDEIGDCLSEKKIITKEISEALNIKFNYRKLSATWDKNTKYYQSEGEIGEGGVVAITCYDWSKKDEENNGWTDNLSIEIYNKEVATFIRQNS
ncbi:hypothetical protein OAM36_00775 [Candidatus Pelagibacter sp.]|nr:hypothetical protein [Candidatus Pelagibacter bacterium]MDC0408059.1 hypothetical protein [Candidatus Pelagibacter sp.]